MATGLRTFLVALLGVLYGERRRLGDDNSSSNTSPDWLLSSVVCSYGEGFLKMEWRFILGSDFGVEFD